MGKIKLQAGGVISYTPFIPNAGVTSSSNTTTETKKDKITGTLQKEIVDILKQNGIPSDVNAFLAKANSYLSQSQSLSDMSIFGGTNDDYSMSQLMHIQSMANEVKFNHETYKEAAANLGDENAWGDLALNERGQLYVLNKDAELKQISISDYKKDTDKYQALTYSQLMGLRERDIPMNTTILNDVKNAVGMQSIAKHVKDIATAFGENSNQFYVNKNKESIQAGIEALLGNGPEGYYKVGKSTKVDDINNAISFLYSNLDPAMKNRLRAEATLSDVDPQEYLLNYLNMALDEYNVTKTTADFDKSATDFDPDGDKKGNGGDGALGEVPYLVRIGRGDGEYGLINISMRTDKVTDSGSMMAWAANMGDLVDKNGERVGMDSLPNILNKVEAIKATRSKDITFGGQLLTDVEKNFIVYDGSSQLTDVWLPFKSIEGRITPDFDKLENFNKWNEWVKQNPGASKLEKMNEASKLGLNLNDMEFDENTGSWKFKQSVMKLFLNFSAYADNDNVKFTKLTENLTEEVDRSVGKRYADLFDNLFTYGKMSRTKSDKKTGMSFDTVYRWDLRHGNVFIPIDSEFLSTHMSMKEYMPKSEMNRFAARSTLAQQLANVQNNTISSLGQFN